MNKAKLYLGNTPVYNMGIKVGRTNAEELTEDIATDIKQYVDSHSSSKIVRW